MNVALITDENYVIPTGTAIASILQSNPDEQFVFYIITKFLEKKSVSLLKSFLEPNKDRALLEICSLSDEYKTDFPIRKGDHVSVATYFRFFFRKLDTAKCGQTAFLGR